MRSITRTIWENIIGLGKNCNESVLQEQNKEALCTFGAFMRAGPTSVFGLGSVEFSVQ
jgi:hypothetical protein